jgi:hypothetical protein
MTNLEGMPSYFWLISSGLKKPLWAKVALYPFGAAAGLIVEELAKQNLRFGHERLTSPTPNCAAI